MSPDRERHGGFLALGDSYTIGEGVSDYERWPNQLAAALRARGFAIDDPRIIATTGWTTNELGVAIDAADPGNDHALVSLLVGVNNHYRGRSVENFAAEFSELLERSITFVGGRCGHVFVVSIPDWGVTTFARDSGRAVAVIATEINAFNATARSIAESKDIAFVDITDLTRDHPNEIVGDGLHPNAAQYTRWVIRLLPIAEKALAAGSIY